MMIDADFDTKESFLGDIMRNHIELLRLADNKANMLLVASGLVLTFSLQFLLQEGAIFYGFLIITASTLASATLALFVIIPRGHTTDTPNLMYFRSFLSMEEDEYVEALKQTIANKNSILEEYARDIYRLGERTLKIKYTYLRFALAVFLGGFFLGSAVLLSSVSL